FELALSIDKLQQEIMKVISQVSWLLLTLIGCFITEGISSAPPPTLSIRREGTKTIVTWQGDNSVFLLNASSAAGPWQIVTNATSPYTVPTNSEPIMFFRLVYQACTNSPCTGT